MPYPYFVAGTLDDLMRDVVDEVIAKGAYVVASKGPMRELTGVLLELGEPRARLSRTETRGKPFSCVGELCWYLAGSNDLSFIKYYLPKYEESAEGGKLFGAYGPRLFSWDGINQVCNATSLLGLRPSSRQAVVQLFDRGDIIGDHKDVACTSTLQFMIRDGALHMLTNMRSNDLFLGLPHDIFCFTMIQEIVATDLSIRLGSYKHTVGSLHLYDENMDEARQFLAEGWQSTTTPMPPMPSADPWPSIALLLKAEEAIRTGQRLEAADLDGLHPYWADLVRLLQVLQCKRTGQVEEVGALRGLMASTVYRPFIDGVLGKLQ